ncbi:hypothetical protein [Candidatus Nitrosocosmicus arcticus]|uniref:Uncharacterized protein n=1 Tax=Candidatus Nitrosocosmicus arcticus TaxID=2035267 RepID=A0A557SZ15_9ARCH|nr:hypothetical protein [Candidatus Nitrosocosmicus arcticus]TVP41846.1 hypothetical protein NARC_10252 [Candidatus Nitrosocosmicus arcticus]
MPRILFQPDSIDGYEFNPIPIDIHLRILKIPAEENLDDYGINTNEFVIVGTERLEVLIEYNQHLLWNLSIKGNLKNQIFDLWSINLTALIKD